MAFGRGNKDTQPSTQPGTGRNGGSAAGDQRVSDYGRGSGSLNNGQNRRGNQG